MRTTASILLLSLIVLVTETASVIPVVKELCKEAAPAAPAKRCGMIEETPACTAAFENAGCAQKKKCGQQEKERNCENKESCTSCPVCYVFTFQPRYELPVRSFSLKNKYPLPNILDLASYSASVWKPPNYIGFLRTV